jgi:hypothetical protein
VIESNTIRTSSGSDFLPGAILSVPCMSGMPLDLPFRPERIGPRYALSHRTNTGPGIRQTATRVSGRSRFRRLASRIIVCVIRECVRLPVEGRGRQEATMRAITVYRMDYSRKSRPSESRRCIGSAPGGGVLLDLGEGRTIPGTDAAGGFVHGGVSARRA